MAGEVLVRTVVLVLTDVEGSTKLWHDEPEAMNTAMARHHEIVHGAVAGHGGWRPVDQGEGDAVFAGFESPTAAVEAVVQLQRELASERWPTSVPLRVRVGAHVGEVIERDGNVFGDPVNRCARVRGLGAGGQSLLSASLFELVRDRLPAATSVRDLGQHRMKDLTRPEHVYQLDIDGLVSGFPPLRSLDVARHNLPVQLSSFVGRESDVAALVELVTEHRLVTVTGFGGMGKTRLALQVAAELADGDGDGVWFIDLSATTDPARVASSIAAVLGIAETGDGPGPAILRGLAHQRLLLVLDNLEQILGSAAFIAELLATCPGVKVLATSRAALRVRGEREFVLAPLSVGGQSAELARTQTAESLSSYAAVRLFVDRAVEARHDFAVTNETAPAVAAICARLDGHPLSIELAAARVRVLAPDALLARLDTALSVLTGGGGDRPERHQTLRATIAWSYDALSATEQRLLDALSVFPGTATLEAIESVCGPVVGDDLDILDGVTTLVENSLVRTHAPTGEDPDTRFSLLVSIRQHAAERLDTAGLAPDIAMRHAAYYDQGARMPLDATPERFESPLFARREVHNLRAALAYLQDHGTPAEEVDFFIGDLLNVLADNGQYDEVIKAAEHAMAREPEPSEGSYATLAALGDAYHVTGRLDMVAAADARAAVHAAGLNRPDLTAQAMLNLIWEATSPSDLQSRVERADDAISAVQATGSRPPRWFLQGLRHQAVRLTMRFVDPGQALRALEQMQHVERMAHQDNWLWQGLVLIALDRGDYMRARDYLETLEEFIESADVPAIEKVSAITPLGTLHLGLGDTDRAMACARRAVRLADDYGATRYTTGAQLLAVACQYQSGDLDAALTELLAAKAHIGAAENPASLGACEWQAARLLRVLDEPGEARATLAEAWEHLAGQQIWALPEMLGCLIERAVHLAPESPEQAAHLLGLVQAHRRDFVLPLDVAEEVSPLLIDLEARLGEVTVAQILAGALTESLPAAEE